MTSSYTKLSAVSDLLITFRARRYFAGITGYGKTRNAGLGLFGGTLDSRRFFKAATTDCLLPGTLLFLPSVPGLPGFVDCSGMK